MRRSSSCKNYGGICIAYGIAFVKHPHRVLLSRLAKTARFNAGPMGQPGAT